MVACSHVASSGSQCNTTRKMARQAVVLKKNAKSGLGYVGIVGEPRM